MRSHLTAVIVGAALVCAAAPAKAAEEVHISVSYETTSTRVASGIRSTILATISATLLGGNRVVDSWNARNGSGRDGGSSELALGRARWRVIGPHELMRIADWPNSQTVLRVFVEGASCRATVEGRLKPGKSVYVFRNIGNRQMEEFTDASYGTPRCLIQ